MRYSLDGPDRGAVFSIFCTIFGIGCLGMPTNYARSGPLFATLAIILMAAINIFASICVSRLLLHAPRHVATLGDIGEWVLGKTGRFLMNFAQLTTCLLAPTTFLVLGSILLDGVFPGALSQTTWIIVMAISLLPLCLLRTLKEATWAAFLGCLGVLVSFIVAISVLYYYLLPYSSQIVAPEPTLSGVIQSFGNLCLAYGTAVVIPSLQRIHPEPQRMPYLIFLTLGVASLLFLFIAVSGYVLVGCQISDNILFALGSSTYGFTTPKWVVLVTYLGMQVHIMMAFSVILHPAFYIMERGIFPQEDPSRAHHICDADASNHPNALDVLTPKAQGTLKSNPYNESVTPLPDGFHGGDDEAKIHKEDESQHEHRLSIRGSIISIADMERDVLNSLKGKHQDEVTESWGRRLRIMAFRILVVAVMVVTACLLKDKLMAMLDFLGSFAVCLCSIFLPLLFYIKQFWKTQPVYEKVICMLMILFCVVSGLYVTGMSGMELFSPTHSDEAFPLCPAGEYQNTLYYQVSKTPATI